jgi:hypothetical protein
MSRWCFDLLELVIGSSWGSDLWKLWNKVVYFFYWTVIIWEFHFFFGNLSLFWRAVTWLNLFGSLTDFISCLIGKICSLFRGDIWLIVWLTMWIW